MKKVLTASLIASVLMVSTAPTFAAEKNLSEIMARFQDEAAKNSEQAAGELVSELFDNKITSTELRDYFSSELSPKDYSKISAFLEKSETNIVTQGEMNKVLMNLGKCANFRGQICSSWPGKVVFFGSLIAFGVYVQRATDKYGEADLVRMNKDLAVHFRDKTEIEIAVLKQNGVTPNNDIYAQKLIDLNEFNQRITDAPAAESSANAKAKTAATSAAIAASVSVLTLGVCNY